MIVSGNDTVLVFHKAILYYYNPTLIDEGTLSPHKFYLYQNYPQPFNPITKIKFTIPSNVKREVSNIALKVYDVLGNEVATLVNEELAAGEYEVEFDGRELTSGIYFYSLITEEFRDTKKMILVK
jgi:hypothetical protein